MPMASEHLAKAEQLATEALRWLNDGQLELARDYRGMAELYLRLADTRYTVIGAAPPPAGPKTELPEWCGACDGPDLNTRWVPVPGPDGRDAMRRCPNCNPYASDQTEVPHQGAPVGQEPGADAHDPAEQEPTNSPPAHT